MHAALAVALGRAMDATPSPTPSLPDPNLVTPGPWGFAIVALLAVVVVLLVFDMMRRIRRGRFRAEINEQLDAEEASGESPAGEETSGEDPPR